MRIHVHDADSTRGYEIFGEVEANDCDGSVYIYKESKESCKPVLADGTLSLTGPSRCIRCPSFSFGVYLKDKHTGFEVSSGFYCPLPYPPSSWFSKPASIVIPGEHGFATLRATMFTSAVEATVEVRLTKGPQRRITKVTGNGDSSNSDHSIHGTLYARCIKHKFLSSHEREYYRRTLFSRSSDDPEDVIDVNPFSRCIIAVPIPSSLIIEADLCDGTDVWGSPAQVAKGTVSFDAPIGPLTRRIKNEITEERGVIEGAEGCIEVKVNWRTV